MRKLTRPQTMREILADNKRSETFLAAQMGKPLRADFPEIKEKRIYTKSANTDDTEAPVLKAIGQLIANHPRVLLGVRQNNGAMFRDGEGGKQIPIWFYRIIRAKVDMVLTDYWGIVQIPGAAFRFVPFMIEVKKPSWTKPSGEREHKQLEAILMVKYAGGLGGFATSVEQAQIILEGR